LAIWHSARDTYQMIHDKWAMPNGKWKKKAAFSGFLFCGPTRDIVVGILLYLYIDN
jgi:hypothetical protein